MMLLDPANLPARFATPEELDAFLARPSQALIADLAEVEGDIMVLGVAGKMGPTLAGLAKAALPARRIIGVARFSEPGVEHWLRARGIEPTLKFLGHGIGQTIHEEPYITDTRTVILQPNITCTMEPLYMIPGRMGFHVEDMYRIVPGGFEAITGAITPNDELIRVG